MGDFGEQVHSGAVDNSQQKLLEAEDRSVAACVEGVEVWRDKKEGKEVHRKKLRVRASPWVLFKGTIREVSSSCRGLQVDTVFAQANLVLLLSSWEFAWCQLYKTCASVLSFPR